MPSAVRSQSCTRSLCLVLLGTAAGLVGCRQAAEVPEPGAMLLRIHAATSGSRPDELRLWIYDDEAAVFDDARLPATGGLPVTGELLGSVIISPGMATGNLRVHARGLLQNARVADGTLVIPVTVRNRGRADLYMQAQLPDDGDGDGVPDSIDNCRTLANPAQKDCPMVDGGAPDTGSVVPGDASPPRDAAAPMDSVPPPPTDDAASDTPAQAGDAKPGDASGNTPDVGADTDASKPDVISSDLGAPADAKPADASPKDSGTSPDATLPRKMLGAGCVAGTECQSGFCADRICCISACNQPCQACVAGACQPVTRKQDIPECAGANTCNASGRCVSN